MENFKGMMPAALILTTTTKKAEELNALVTFGCNTGCHPAHDSCSDKELGENIWLPAGTS